MDLMATAELREIAFELLGPDLCPAEKAEFDAGWNQLQSKGLRLGLEILECETEGLSYAAGARRPGDWPLLARTHYGVIGLLNEEIPRDLLAQVRVMLERARLLDAEGFGQDLLLAAAHDRTPGSALVRFAIYELIRVNLWLLTWEQARLEAVGAMTEIDEEAERILRNRLNDLSTYEAEARPLLLLVIEALHELIAVARKREAMIAQGGKALRQLYDGLTKAAQLARSLGAADASVLRNEYAEHVGDERLESVLLSERHPRILPSPQAVDTRRSRLLSAVRGNKVSHRECRVVDLMREIYLGEGGRH